MENTQVSDSNMQSAQLGIKSNDYSETPALSDIQAAMMEELGIGRKDKLPLQDISKNLPRNLQDHVDSLKPKSIAPGVATWRNAVFDDVDPTEDQIDSIADGQLARIRRRRGLSDGHHDTLSHQKQKINQDLDHGNHTIKANIGAPLPKNSSNLSNLNNNLNEPKRPRHQNLRVETSIARLRAAVPSLTSSEVSKRPVTPKNETLKSHQPSKDQEVANQKKPKASKNLPKETGNGQYSSNGKKSSRRSIKKKPLQKRAPIPKSAWGSLDEDAFLAFAIKSTTPNSPQNETNMHKSNHLTLNEQKIYDTNALSANKSQDLSDSGLAEKSSQDKSLTSPDNRKNSREITTPQSNSQNNHYRQKSDVSELASDVLEKSREKRANQLDQKYSRSLQGSIWARDTVSSPNAASNDFKMADNLNKQSPSQVVIKEASVKIQKNAALGQSGKARLLRKEGSALLMLELEQNGQITVQDFISSDATFTEDPLNPELLIIYKAPKKQKQKTKWRILFEDSAMKNDFQNSINRASCNGDVASSKTLQNELSTAIQESNELLNFEIDSAKKSISLNMPAKSSPPTPYTSLLDNPGIYSYSFDHDLIHISSSSSEDEAIMDQPLSAQHEKINAETFNDLSEIGGVLPFTSDSQAFNVEETSKITRDSFKDLVDVNDDILIEGLYKEIVRKTKEPVLDLLSDTLIRQQGSADSSINSEEIRHSIRCIKTLRTLVAKSLSDYEIFMQLPPEIAEEYVTDKTQKIIEKCIGKREIPGFQPSNALKTINEILSLESVSTVSPSLSSNLLPDPPSKEPSRITYNIDDLLGLRHNKLFFQECSEKQISSPAAGNYEAPSDYYIKEFPVVTTNLAHRPKPKSMMIRNSANFLKSGYKNDDSLHNKDFVSEGENINLRSCHPSYSKATHFASYAQSITTEFKPNSPRSSHGSNITSTEDSGNSCFSNVFPKNESEYSSFSNISPRKESEYSEFSRPTPRNDSEVEKIKSPVCLTKLPESRKSGLMSSKWCPS